MTYCVHMAQTNVSVYVAADDCGCVRRVREAKINLSWNGTDKWPANEEDDL